MVFWDKSTFLSHHVILNFFISIIAYNLEIQEHIRCVALLKAMRNALYS